MSGFLADPAAIRTYATAVAGAGTALSGVATEVPEPGLRAPGFGRVAQTTAGSAFETAVDALAAAVGQGGELLQQVSGGLQSAASTYEQDDQASSGRLDDCAEAL